GCVESARRYLASLRGDPGHAEIDLRYQVQSGAVRVAGPDEQRKKRPGEWTARIDLLRPFPGGVHVIDWKTGRQENTAPAATNPQTKLGAVAAARWAGVRRARVSLVYLDEHRYDVDEAEFGALELAIAAEDLRALRRQVTGGPTPPVPGP